MSKPAGRTRAVESQADVIDLNRPCQMMLSAPDEDEQRCGAVSVGGNRLYRYCKRHLEMVEHGGGVVYRDGWA